MPEVNQPPTCAYCGEEYTLSDFDSEPTKYCDECAHERVSAAEALIEQLDGAGVSALSALAWLPEDGPIRQRTSKVCEEIRAALAAYATYKQGGKG
jgi:hypothetical protein